MGILCSGFGKSDEETGEVEASDAPSTPDD